MEQACVCTGSGLTGHLPRRGHPCWSLLVWHLPWLSGPAEAALSLRKRFSLPSPALKSPVLGSVLSSLLPPWLCFWCFPPHSVSLSPYLSLAHTLSLGLKFLPPLLCPCLPPSLSLLLPQFLPSHPTSFIHSLSLSSSSLLLICHCVPLQFPFSIACAFSLTRILTHPLLHLLSSFNIF